MRSWNGLRSICIAFKCEQFPIEQVLGTCLLDGGEIADARFAVIVDFRRTVGAGVENQIAFGANAAAGQNKIDLVFQVGLQGQRSMSRASTASAPPTGPFAGGASESQFPLLIAAWIVALPREFFASEKLSARS